MQGLALRSYKYNLPKGCEAINKISHKFLILFSDDLSNDDKAQASNCFIAGGPEIIDVKGVKFGLTKIQKEEFEKVQQSLKEKVSILKVMKDKKFKVKSKDTKISVFEKQRVYRLDKSLSKNKSLLASLIRANLYLELNYNGKVETIIRTILEREYIEEFFDVEPVLSIDQIELAVLDILVNLKDRFDDQKLVETLVSYLSYEVSQGFRDKLKDEFDIPNRLSYVQERIKSYNYALSFPFVWGNWIEKYSSTIELSKFLEKTQMYEKLKNNELNALGMLRSYFPLSKDKRETILKAYKNLGLSDKSRLKDLKFRLEENEQFKQYLIKNEINKKPVFVEKRKFYKEEIRSHNTINYSLYNLLKLGDLKEEYFIKSLAVKAYEI